ncbi:MAG: LPS biosynthesis protein WbpP [Candidatus Cloacimonas sp. 4484_209]|nr:MAG: LPS biosynthesis protein WbpP [Candidatus Cloacimonas sp. 4484_209]
MKALVTGGAGFIGCNLVRRLLKEGIKVRVFDNFSTGKRENLTDVDGDLEVFEGDLRDFAQVLEATKGIEIIFHEAALPSVIRSVKAPNTTNDVNIAGTLNLLEASKVNRVRKIIYASSSSIYGNSLELPKRENMIPNPLSPYAVSKIAGEYYMKVFHHLYGIETVILRYFNVYGPYQDPTSEYSGVIAKFITAFLNNKPLTVFGDGEQSRDFTYVDDVVEANILAANADISGEVVNISFGKRATINNLIEYLKEMFQTNIKLKYTEPRAGDVKHSLADISKAKELLGYNSTIDFQSGLLKTVHWYKQTR